jgi:hypothetical protein
VDLTSVKDEYGSSAKSKSSKPLPELLWCFLKPRNLNSDQEYKALYCILSWHPLGEELNWLHQSNLKRSQLDEPIFPIFALGMLTERVRKPANLEGQRDLLP